MPSSLQLHKSLGEENTERKTQYPTHQQKQDIIQSSPQSDILDPQFLLYCQSYVNKKVRVGGSSEMTDNSGGGCCSSCGRCISAVPGPSLCCWILLTIGVCCCGAGVYVGVERTRELLEKTDTFLQYADIAGMAVLGGMVFLGLLFLLVATTVSYPTNKHIFNTAKKNTCGRVMNLLVIFILLFFYFVWICCTLVLAVPVMYFVLLAVLYKHEGFESLNLKNYGLYQEDYIIEGSTLETFYSKGQDAFICYIVAMCGSVLVLFSLTFHLMCAAANTVHMREARFAAFNAYKNEVNTSKTSVLDTRM